MKRNLIVGLLALLPLLAAMPCLCKSDAPKKAKSCCCHNDSEEKPLQKKKCCCDVLIKADFTVQAAGLPLDVEGIVVETTPGNSPAPADSDRDAQALDTGPPDPALYVSISSLKL